MTYCVFDLFTEPLPEESSTGGSGKNQLIRRLETGLHFFLGNTECLTTCLLRNDITSAVSVSWCPRYRYCQSTGIQCWSGCLDWFWIACWIDFSDICDPNWRLNVPTNFDHLSGYYQLLPLFNLTHIFCSPLKTLAQGGLQNEGHAETPDFPVSTSSSCLCPGKSVIQALLYSFIFCRWIAGGCDAFPSPSFEADDDTDETITVRSRMKAERGKSYGSAALPKQKWNGPLSRTHHSHRDLFIRGKWGREGVASSMCPVRRQVWQWAFVLLVGQPRKRSCLAGASTCFSLGAPNQFVSLDTLALI